MNAQTVRQFLATLFTGRYVRSLEQHIEELKQERDYFRGRAERFEMRLLPERKPIAPTLPAVPANLSDDEWVRQQRLAGKRFAQIEQEWAEREFASDTEQKKEN